MNECKECKQTKGTEEFYSSPTSIYSICKLCIWNKRLKNQVIKDDIIANNYHISYFSILEYYRKSKSLEENRKQYYEWITG